MLLYPSREDSFAKSVSEAMMLGLPVITSDNPHFHAVYANNLIYADSNCHEHYATLILELLSKQDYYNACSKRSIAFVESLPPNGNYVKFRDVMLDVLTAKQPSCHK